jgi:hypothetical protein
MNGPIALAANMPTNTGVLTLRRASSEAPAAHTSGARPQMKAIEVIITARKHSFAPARFHRRLISLTPCVANHAAWEFRRIV